MYIVKIAVIFDSVSYKNSHTLESLL